MTVLAETYVSSSLEMLQTPLAVISPAGSLCVSAAGTQRTPRRALMEAFVRHGYRARFGAEVSSFMPWLLGASDDLGALRAVIGVRFGGAEPLFLEQYLDQPIETALSRVVGCEILRHQVLEAGNLVTDPSSVAPPFFQAFLVWSMASSSCEWLVFTGTRAVRTLLRRLGAELFEIIPARPERLREAPDQWGAYYRHQPCVVAASIAELVSLLDPELFDPVQLRACIDRGLELRR